MGQRWKADLWFKAILELSKKFRWKGTGRPILSQTNEGGSG